MRQLVKIVSLAVPFIFVLVSCNDTVKIEITHKKNIHVLRKRILNYYPPQRPFFLSFVSICVCVLSQVFDRHYLNLFDILRTLKAFKK